MLFCQNGFLSNLSMHFLGFYLYAMVALVFLKKVLVTEQLELGKTKINNNFLVLRLSCWRNKKLQTNNRNGKKTMKYAFSCEDSLKSLKEQGSFQKV